MYSTTIAALFHAPRVQQSAGALDASLTGLNLSASVAAIHGVPDVADTIVAALAKIPMQVRSMR
jgi:hypothetical protein